MSIIDTFDPDKSAVIEWGAGLSKSEIVLPVCIVNFSYKITDALLEDGLRTACSSLSAKAAPCPRSSRYIDSRELK